jgi:hypothetical protein
LVLHVAINRHHPAPEASGKRRHGERVETLLVGQPERCIDHVFAAQRATRTPAMKELDRGLHRM